MHIKPYLGGEIGRGKSGFTVNRGAVNRGFTVYIYMYVLSMYYIACFIKFSNKTVVLTSDFIKVSSVEKHKNSS